MSRDRKPTLRWLTRAGRSVGRGQIVVLAIAAIVGVAALSLGLVALRSSEPEGPRRAVIVDQLSLTFPNPEFIASARATLERAGYIVDYYPGEQATVDLFSRFPAIDYDLVILRAHSARFISEREGEPVDEAMLFTSDRYTEEKVVEFESGYSQYADGARVWPFGIARYVEGGEQLIGIGPDFVEHRMDGDFDGATVILMGCDILSGEKLAEAFVNKGASAVVGWDRDVSASHTDLATEHLLQLLVDDVPAEGAVDQTMAEVGPDPAFGSVLRSYTPDG